MINSHMKSHPYKEIYTMEDSLLTEIANTDPMMDAQFLQEYVKYAKEKCRPEMS